MIEVLDPGLFTTVQDRGRPGWSHLGISAGGAADPASYRVANALVGNAGGEAALEMTLTGGRFRFHADVDVALTGGTASASIAAWETVRLRAGEELACGALTAGARAYLAVAGGIDVPKVLGSRSTLAGAALGGFRGRPLRAGDALSLGVADEESVRCRTEWRPALDEETELLMIPLREEGRALAASVLTVAEPSNRAGLRLEGAPIFFDRYEEPITEGVLWGTVQLPSSGKPIVLMNDQTTTGGYPKIAQVIQRDRARLGQLRPGSRVRFRIVDIREATMLLREHEDRLRAAVEPL